MVSARRAHGFYLAVVNPLLDRGIAYPQRAGGVVQFEQVHVTPREFAAIYASQST